MGLQVATGSGKLRKGIVDLVEGRPGWRLEPRTTPGATPLWCFVTDGEIEFSVTVEGSSIRLYVMATDEEIALKDVDALAAWLGAHRADALGEPVPRVAGKAKLRRFMDWS